MVSPLISGVTPAFGLTNTVCESRTAASPASAPVSIMIGSAVLRVEMPTSAAPSEFCITARISRPFRLCRSQSKTEPSSKVVATMVTT